MKSSVANRRYLKSLTRQISEVPRAATAEVAIRLFTGVIASTEIDSGQAMLNWQMTPYSGSASFEQQQMFWGYGSVEPIAPAGYKWTGGANVEAVISYQYTYALTVKASLEAQDFDGVVIYNPIAPGFSGFSPGDDSQYYSHALGPVEAVLARIIETAKAEGYQATVRRFHFVSLGA